MNKILKTMIVATTITLCSSYSYGQLANLKQTNTPFKKNDNSLLSASLQEIVALTETKTNANIKKLSSKWIVKNNKVLIDARCTNSDQLQLKIELESIGMENAKIYGSVVNGWMPIDNVEKMENCKFLKKAIPEKRPHTNLGVVTNEAEIVMNSKEAKRVFGVDGTGIKIGILSDSFNAQGGYEKAVLSGDLPGLGNPNGFTKPVVVLSDLARQDIEGLPFSFPFDEGRAMAELIHDIAPGAELYFHTASDGFFDFADGIRELAAAGCTVIVDDITYPDSAPYFQVGAVAKAVNDVKQNGVTYFSSAGNEGSAYLNDFKVIENPTLENPNPESPFELMDFGDNIEFLEYEVPKGGVFQMVINWSDSSIFSGNENVELKTDLGIYVYTEGDDEPVLLNIDNIEEGSPAENVFFSLGENDEPEKIRIAINKFSGVIPRKVHISVAGDAKLINLPAFNGPSCFGHANAEGTITVGASSYLDTPEFGSPNYLIEDFSSVGGLPILIDENDQQIEPIIRQKPDIVGPDGVNNSFFGEDVDNDGFLNFFGTSASAPNVAAIAALMLELKPDLTPDDIRQALIDTAIDMDDPATPEFDKGFDFKTGNGFVLADAALAHIAETPVVYRYELIDPITGQFLRALRDGDSIDISKVKGGARFNVAAIATNKQDKIQRVNLELQGRQNNFRIDKSFPYTLRNESNAWNAKNGEFSIIGQSFSNRKNSEKNRVNFTLHNSSYIRDFQLVDNDDTNLVRWTYSTDNNSSNALSDTSQEEINNLNFTSTLGSETNNSFNILAAEEVFYRVYGPNTSYVNRSSAADFLAFVNSEGVATPWFPAPTSGSYTLEATPLARAGDMDTAGKTMRYEFNLDLPEINSSGEKLLTNAGNRKINIFPNPSTGIINLESLHNENLLDITVYNTAGAKVYSNTNNLLETTKINIDLSGVSKGLYFVKAIYANKIEVLSKVIIE